MDRTKNNYYPGFRRMATVSILIGLVFLLFPAGLFAFDTAPLDSLDGSDKDLAERGISSFEDARQSMWAGTGSQDEILGLLDRSESSFAGIGDIAAREYLMARVVLYRGRGELTWGKKSDARDLFEEAMELATSSIEREESSEALRVLADAGSSWMITKGLGGIIKMAPQVQEWSDRSLELDPLNPLALIINAQGQINAPKSAGGDPEAAAERLEILVARTDLDDISLFWGRVSLAQAYGKLKEKEDSERLCNLAAQIFPDSSMLEDCQ